MGFVRPLSWQAVVAGFGALVLWLGGSAGQLPWPHPAGASLAALLVLVAVTRITGDMGRPMQKRLRYSVAGVAIAASSWFGGMAVMVDSPALLLLSGLHVVTAWLAAYGEPDATERRRGIMILAASATTLSLLALVVPSFEQPATGEVLAAGVLATGVVFSARGKLSGGAIAALGAAAALVVTSLHLAGWFAIPPSALAPAFTPLVGMTCAVSAVATLVAFAPDLTPFWRGFAPAASDRTLRALVVTSVPAAFALAAVPLLWTGF